MSIYCYIEALLATVQYYTAKANYEHDTYAAFNNFKHPQPLKATVSPKHKFVSIVKTASQHSTN